MATRISHFFDNVAHLEIPVARFFSKKLIGSSKERSLLKQLSTCLDSMQEKSLIDTYIYIVYSLLRAAATNTDSINEASNCFGCVIFASNQILQQIYTNKNTLEHQKSLDGSLRP